MFSVIILTLFNTYKNASTDIRGVGFKSALLKPLKKYAE